MTKRLLLPRSQAVGLDGRPLAGAKLYTFVTGTSTPKAVFTDAGLSVAHTNPVIADAAGRFPAMFLAVGDYRTVLTDAADVTIATDDPVEGQVEPTVPPWTDVASAASMDLGFVNSENLRITGTTTITAFGTAASGTRRQLRFAGSLVLTHNATSLILPGGANITTAAGDTAVAVSLGGGNWVVVEYTPAALWSWQMCEPPRVVSAVTQVDFALPTAFRAYRLQVLDFVPSVNAERLLLRFSSDGGATFLNAANYSSFGHETVGTTGASFQNLGLTRISLAGELTNGAANALQAEYHITPGTTTIRPRVRGLSAGANGTPFFASGYYMGSWEGTLARMNAIRLFTGSGTMTGTFILEGLR